MENAPARKPHVVIVGAGFGGLEAAKLLIKEPVRMTVIDRTNHHLFQPLLYQVATSLLNAEDVCAPVRSLFRHQDNVTFHMATVTGIDAAGQNIQLDDGKQISYDYLVLAGGATVNYFNTPGAAEQQADGHPGDGQSHRVPAPKPNRQICHTGK